MLIRVQTSMVVEATVFEPQILAYSPFTRYTKDPGIIGVALPCRIDPDRIFVDIEAPSTAKLFPMVPVIDVGPWNVADSYWRNNSRPLVETQRFEREKAQNNLIPTNKAGIDLTYALARKLGLPIEWKGTLKITIHEIYEVSGTPSIYFYKERL